MPELNYSHTAVANRQLKSEVDRDSATGESMPDTDARQQPSRSNRVTLWFLAILFLVMGSIGFLIGGRTVLEDWRYQRQAIKTQAVTTAKTLRLATTDTDTVYELSYRFNLADGKPYERIENVPVRLWESVERGSQFVAEYLPGQPGLARVVRDRPDRRQLIGWGFGVGGILLLLSLFLFKAALRRRSTDHDSNSVNAVVVVPESRTQSSYWPLAFRSVGFWIGGMFLLVAVPMVIAVAILFYNDWTFVRNARSTDGMVLTKEIDRSGRQNRTREYRLTYRYTVDGKTL